MVWTAVAMLVAVAGGCGGAGPAGPNGSQAKPLPAREFAIEGMTCQGCAETVTEALAGLPGVERVEVLLEGKRARVVADPEVVPDSAIETAVAQAGYKARPMPAGQATPQGPPSP